MLIETLTIESLRQGNGDFTQQQAFRELEWRKCKESYNYWRFHYGWLKLKSGSVMRWKDPFACQIESGELWQAGDSTIDVKSRQLGETTDGVHFCEWDCMFHEAVIWNVFGAGEDEGKDVIERIRATSDRLPPWMVQKAQQTVGSINRHESANRKNKQDGIMAVSYGLSKIVVRTGALTKAQGLAGKVLVDDFGKHGDQRRKWELMFPVIDDPDPENRGQVIIIFNGNGDDFACKLYKKAKAKGLPLKARFFWWGCDHRRLRGAYITDETGKKTPMEEASYPDIVKAYLAERMFSPWYESAKESYLIENPDADIYSFRAQYPTTEDEAFYINGNSFFDLATLNAWDRIIHEKQETKGFKRLGSLLEPNGVIEWETRPQGKCRLYEEPVNGERYVVSVDAAGGGNYSDYSVIWVNKVSDDFRTQVFVYQARPEIIDLALMTLRVCHWYNEALLLIEVGASGHGVALMQTVKEEYTNLYRTLRTSKWSDEEKEDIGWVTSGKTRDTLLHDLSASLGRYRNGDWEREPTMMLNDMETLVELSRFGINLNTGKAEAPRGGTDDLVMAGGMAEQGAKSLGFHATISEARILMPWE